MTPWHKTGLFAVPPNGMLVQHMCTCLALAKKTGGLKSYSDFAFPCLGSMSGASDQPDQPLMQKKFCLAA